MYGLLQNSAAADVQKVKIKMLLVAAFYLKHNLSNSVLNDFINILSISRGSQKNAELKSAYSFLKKYDCCKPTLRKIYPCKNWQYPRTWRRRHPKEKPALWPHKCKWWVLYSSVTSWTATLLLYHTSSPNNTELKQRTSGIGLSR